MRQVNGESSGSLAEHLVMAGSWVHAGQALVRLENPDLLLEIRALRMQLQQIQAQELRAQALLLADLEPLRRQRLATQAELDNLERQRVALTVLAPVDGVWTLGDAGQGVGRWIAKGEAIGAIVDTRRHRFVAVLPQVSTHVLEGNIKLGEVRLSGEEGSNLIMRDISVVPFEQGVLPSRALGYAGGGQVSVKLDDPTGLVAAEPFFRIHASFDTRQSNDVALVHGRQGVLRITMAPKPLLEQWERSLRQSLQRRFQV
jgi:putative peptide zinc metalloprotease protein